LEIEASCFGSGFGDGDTISSLVGYKFDYVALRGKLRGIYGNDVISLSRNHEAFLAGVINYYQITPLNPPPETRRNGRDDVSARLPSATCCPENPVMELPSVCLKIYSNGRRVESSRKRTSHNYR
jgi:hypothetical protein